MKNIIKIIFAGLFIFNSLNFTSCGTSDDSNNEELSEVLGEWELYRNENLESIIDVWTGTEWTYKNEWFQTTRDNSQIFLLFKMEGTFDGLYANVLVNGGTWVKLVKGSYYFDYVAEVNDLDEAFTQRRYLKILCDNTFSIEYEGDERRIDYYRKRNTTECFELINYNVE